MWSANNFKSTVSPQELMQEIAVLSKKRFRIGQRSECLDLFVWLMGILHRGLGSSAKAATVSSSSNSKNSTASTSVKKTLVSPSLSVVYEPFQVISYYHRNDFYATSIFTYLHILNTYIIL